jgi:N-acetylneuraminate lyase
VGIKYTNPDMMAYQFALRAGAGRWDLPWGGDETLIAALAMGARGAIGSGYNFAAPIYLRLLEAFSRGDWERAREEQFRGVRLVELLAGYGYMGAAKTVMGFLGVDVGPARLPNANLSPEQTTALREALERMEFFKWVGA